jgi:hypothetical protein
VGKWGSGVWGVGRINKNNLLNPDDRIKSKNITDNSEIKIIIMADHG